MLNQKIRYKAKIAGQTYTIIGNEDSHHMDLVTKLVNDQLREIKQQAPALSTEDAAVLLAVNALSDQLKKQEELLTLQKRSKELQKRAIKATELENKLQRIEGIEAEAKQVLEQNGQKNLEITSYAQAQQILNEDHKRKIQQKTTQR